MKTYKTVKEMTHPSHFYNIDDRWTHLTYMFRSTTPLFSTAILPNIRLICLPIIFITVVWFLNMPSINLVPVLHPLDCLRPMNWRTRSWNPAFIGIACVSKLLCKFHNKGWKFCEQHLYQGCLRITHMASLIINILPQPTRHFPDLLHCIISIY